VSTFSDSAALQSILAPELSAGLDGYTPEQSFAERFARLEELSPLERMEAVDLQTYLPGDILVKADRATMAYSLESRSPWLDYRLAELASRLPSGMKANPGAGKIVFKKAVEPLLPAAILTRPKMGFSVPLAAWFRTSLKRTFETSVLQAGMEKHIRLDEA